VEKQHKKKELNFDGRKKILLFVIYVNVRNETIE